MHNRQYQQYWQERQYGPPMHMQHHHRYQRFHDPYEGRQNYWRDSYQDNYYHHPHHSHYHRHHHRDREIPRFVEKLLDGILSGELLRNLDIKPDKVRESSTDDNWKERAFQRASSTEQFSPDDQLSMNLDFTPPQEQRGPEEKGRFGRTG